MLGSAYLECSDPRDDIYGVLRLVQWPVGSQLVPDYTKSATHLALDVIDYLDDPNTGTIFTMLSRLEISAKGTWDLRKALLRDPMLGRAHPVFAWMTFRAYPGSASRIAQDAGGRLSVDPNADLLGYIALEPEVFYLSPLLGVGYSALLRKGTSPQLIFAGQRVVVIGDGSVRPGDIFVLCEYFAFSLVLRESSSTHLKVVGMALDFSEPLMPEHPQRFL